MLTKVNQKVEGETVCKAMALQVEIENVHPWSKQKVQNGKGLVSVLGSLCCSGANHRSSFMRLKKEGHMETIQDDVESQINSPTKLGQ